MAKNRISLTIFYVLVCLGLAFFPVSHAAVFCAVDSMGVIHLTNIPSMPSYHLMFYISDAHKNSEVQDSKKLKHSTKTYPYKEQVVKAARSHNLDQALLRAIITVESNNNPKAVSSDGAIGLMQLMPKTAERYGASNLYNPAENIQAGAKYLHHLMQRFDGNLSLALAAYNAGEGAVISHGNHIPPYPETRQYIPRVLSLYRYYRAANR